MDAMELEQMKGTDKQMHATNVAQEDTRELEQLKGMDKQMQWNKCSTGRHEKTRTDERDGGK